MAQVPFLQQSCIENHLVMRKANNNHLWNLFSTTFNMNDSLWQYGKKNMTVRPPLLKL